MRGLLVLVAAVLAAVALGIGALSLFGPVARTTSAEDAIRSYLRAHGHGYIGDCAKTRIPADIGKYCSALRKDDGAEREYLVGPVASEGDIFTLARGGTGWTIVSIAVTPAPGP